MKFAFHTLGCKLNFSESSTIAHQLALRGHTKVEQPQDADLLIVNTCSVTDSADRKCRQAITKLHRLNPKAKIIVTGCYAQLQPQRLLSINGVSKVISKENKFNIDAYLDSPSSLTSDTFTPSLSYEERTRCFLKIQDGCDYFCSYCTIPLARGHSRSGEINQIATLAQQAADNGAKEIVLTGVNIGTFGFSNPVLNVHTQPSSLLELCKALDNIKGIARFRISSIEPNLLSDELIDFTLHSRLFAPHFHIPLQSGSNEVLKLMKRRYNRELFQQKVLTIKSICPNAFIGVDVIVGMRGESRQMFEDCLDFIQQLPITQLHIFPYSERSGTLALQIKPIVSESEKRSRAELLHTVSEQKTHDFYHSHIGSSATVLWESAPKRSKHSGALLMHGFTENYIRVSTPFNPDLVGSLQQVRLGEINTNDQMLSLTAIPLTTN